MGKWIGNDAVKSMMEKGLIKFNEDGHMTFKDEKLEPSDFENNGAMLFSKIELELTVNPIEGLEGHINNFLQKGCKENLTSVQVDEIVKGSTEKLSNSTELGGGKEDVTNANTTETHAPVNPGPDATPAEKAEYEKKKTMWDKTKAFFGVCWDNTKAAAEKVSKVDPNSPLVKLGLFAIMGGLSLAALNEMASANNGCYMFNVKTGDQLQPLISIEGGKKCNCSSPSVQYRCQDLCNQVFGAGVQKALVCGNVKPEDLTPDTASSVCQCTDPQNKAKPSTDFTVHTVNDNAFTMFAKVLAAGGLAITGLIGTGEDIAMQIAETTSGLAADVKLVLIIGGVVAGVVILVLAFYFIFSGKRRAEANKKLLAAAQAPPPSVVIGASPSPGQTPFPAPINPVGQPGPTNLTVLSVAPPRNFPTQLPPAQSTKDMMKIDNLFKNMGALSAGGGSHSWRSGLRGGGKWNGYAMQMM